MIPLAIGLIIGGAFSILVNSLTNDIINQAFSKIFGYKSLSYLSYGTTRWERIWVYINNSKNAIAIKEMPIDGTMYGKFLSVIITFFITSLFIFSIAFISYSIMKRFINKAKEEKVTPIDKLILNELKKLNENLDSKNKF